MLNFGLDRMRIVAPRDGWPNPAAVAMASGAGRLLDHAGLFPDVAAAVADCDYVIATTARARDLVKPVLTPERAMAEARVRSAAGQRVAVLFGPERTGLENDDLLPAQALVIVPVNPDFPSLNLAQCALLLAYEWRRAGDTTPPETLPLAGGELATAGDVDRLAAHWEERLAAAGFFFPPDKVPHMKASLRNMWGRLGLTRSEVQTFHGILKQIAWKLARQQD
jgi:tRNA/rRNA methyltransferase